jgi:hypothetical protein
MFDSCRMDNLYNKLVQFCYVTFHGEPTFGSY